MDVDAFLDNLKQDPGYAGQIVHVQQQPARDAVWGVFPPDLLDGVKEFLAALGIERPYRHQEEAMTTALAGRDLLLTTGTASGKSLCYQVPILQALLADPNATALFVFPAKALARDQAATWNQAVRSLTELDNPEAIAAVPYDGDSSAADRRTARDAARVILTNPEMLHVKMIPGHGRWQRFLQGLRYIVIDEVHTYTGFFGANMANVLRRLERLCEFHGSTPQFICCSATVGNPEEVAQTLTSRPMHLVDQDTSGCGRRTFVFWNPPRIKKREWRGRRSANVEAHELMAKLIQRRVATICFSKARNTAEMVYRYVREKLERESPGLVDKVIPYRGGYTPAERRDLERRLREGELLGVSATRALELGIDIGMLEACIIIGYPGVLNAFLQQAGRAGRGQADSLCILVGIDTPINQYIMEHPEFIFARPIERIVIDRDNPFVVIGHIRCAAAERPFGQADIDRFGYAAPLVLDVLEEHEKVYHGEDAWYHSANEEPAFEVRLRGYGDESTVIEDADTGRVIDRIDKFRAMRLFYQGAIYFHHGDTWALVDHDTDRNLVRLRRVESTFYTDPVTGTSVDHIDVILDHRPIGIGQAYLGEVYAVLETPVYERVKFYTLDRLSQHPTGLPNIAYEAMSFWVTIPASLAAAVRGLNYNPDAGLRAVNFCVSRILPLFLTSDANDFDWSIGAKNAPWHTMFWFEFYLRGIGNSEQCFDRLEEILPVALDHLLTCDCEDGCPNCSTRPITPYHVRNIELGEGGEPVSRQAGCIILNSLLTGQNVQQSIELLQAPRARGQHVLPALASPPRLSAPNRMPLDDRTRKLLGRKLERSRLPKPALDHFVDPRPPVGVPPEAEQSLAASDPEKRSGTHSKRTAAGLGKHMRRRLNEIAGRRAAPPAPAGAAAAPEEPTVPAGKQLRRQLDALAERRSSAPDESRETPAAAEDPQDRMIKLGDEIARKVNRLRRKRKPQDP